MVGKKGPGGPRRGTHETLDQRPRRAWERPAPKSPDPDELRATFRADAPSPGQEVLAQHEAELVAADVETIETPETIDTSEVICF